MELDKIIATDFYKDAAPMVLLKTAQPWNGAAVVFRAELIRGRVFRNHQRNQIEIYLGSI